MLDRRMFLGGVSGCEYVISLLFTRRGALVRQPSGPSRLVWTPKVLDD